MPENNVSVTGGPASYDNAYQKLRIPKTVENHYSLTSMALPVDVTTLELHGYTLSQYRGPAAELEKQMLECAAALGRTVTSALLSGNGDSNALPIHTEGVYLPVPTPYFLLGCLEPAVEGGTTQIYDARKGARILLEERPELLNVLIEYGSLAHKRTAEHALITRCLVGGRDIERLIFREQCETNTIKKLPVGWTLASFYAQMALVLDRSLALSHEWRCGDIMIVDNRLTLHGRAPYRGRRQMVRLRIDEYGTK